MNAPIYMQPISNGGDANGEQGRGADATWLRALNDLEHDDDAPPAWVAQAAPPPLAPNALTLIPTQVADSDPYTEDCASPVCLHQWHYAQQRSAGRSEEATDAVTG